MDMNPPFKRIHKVFIFQTKDRQARAKMSYERLKPRWLQHQLMLNLKQVHGLGHFNGHLFIKPRHPHDFNIGSSVCA